MSRKKHRCENYTDYTGFEPVGKISKDLRTLVHMPHNHYLKNNKKVNYVGIAPENAEVDIGTAL